jgi:hypothetical protein
MTSWATVSFSELIMWMIILIFILILYFNGFYLEYRNEDAVDVILQLLSMLLKAVSILRAVLMYANHSPILYEISRVVLYSCLIKLEHKCISFATTLVGKLGNTAF